MSQLGFSVTTVVTVPAPLWVTPAPMIAKAVSSVSSVAATRVGVYQAGDINRLFAVMAGALLSTGVMVAVCLYK